MKSRKKIIKYIFNKHKNNSVFITNTGYISRAIYNLYPNNKNIFYMQGSMGLSPCIALGIALNTKKNVISICGDASLLMHLGITHTIRDYNLKNLFVYILDNGCHESVGKQKCSTLLKKYPGINKIFKINTEGKTERVNINCNINKKIFMKYLNN